MKFTAGYLMGATTVVGLGAAFLAGFASADWAHARKNQAATQISDATVAGAIHDLIKNRGK
jgi:hypothetical protein